MLQDIVNSKKKLLMLNPNLNGINEGNKKGIFTRILEVITINKQEIQEELERTIKGAQLIQEEIYMSKI